MGADVSSFRMRCDHLVPSKEGRSSGNFWNCPCERWSVVLTHNGCRCFASSLIVCGAEGLGIACDLTKLGTYQSLVDVKILFEGLRSGFQLLYLTYLNSHLPFL